MRKNLKFLLIMVLTLSIPLVTYAYDITDTYPNDPNSTIEVKASFDSSYTVIIPDSINFGNRTTTSATVSVSDVFVDDGEQLNISLSSQNGWRLVNGNSSLSYDAKIENSSITDQTISIPSGTAYNEAEIEFTITDAVKVSGHYEDILTFSISVG